MPAVAKERKRRGPKPKSGKQAGPVLFVRLDDDTDAAIRAFIAAQVVPPDKTAVTYTALHQFLERQGFWPPPRKPSA